MPARPAIALIAVKTRAGQMKSEPDARFVIIVDGLD
jgi:hypothetical protein